MDGKQSLLISATFCLKEVVKDVQYSSCMQRGIFLLTMFRVIRVILSLVSDNKLLQSMPHIHQTLLQSSLHTRIT